LLAEDNAPSLTYAALECRLTIEIICYERLLHSHDYISPSDLKGWQPSNLVRQVSEEANELIDQGFELHISDAPVQEGAEPKTKEDYESFNYVKVGQQVGFKISKMGSLWNALSKVALHVNFSTGIEELSPYGDADSVKTKVLDALTEFRKFVPNTLIGSGFGATYSFPCDICSAQIRRKVELLKDKQVVGCFNPTCDESYTIHLDGPDITHSRRESLVRCKKCTSQIALPTRKAEKLRFGEVLEVLCPVCEDTTKVALQIMQETATRSTP
jgi:hypothetical protein